MNTEITHEGISVQAADDDQLEKWDDLVSRSPQGTVVHRLAFLRTVADHTGTDLRLLVGRKGQETVGLFPLFAQSVGPLTVAFSPPPNVGLSVLGPAMLGLAGMKPQTREKRTRRFVQACLDWLEAAVSPAFTHVRTHQTFPDGRPFAWNEFDLTTRYTYVVDLDGDPEDVKSRFSSDARRNIRDAEEAATVRERTGPAAIDRVIRHLRRRHAEQGIDYPVESAFVRDLADRLDDDHLTVYHATVDGQYRSGMIALTDDTTAYRWQGGARPVGDDYTPVNDLLDWRVMSDALSAGRTAYDLVGANTPGLCQYKSKFGPELRSYQSAQRTRFGVGALASIYQRLK